jgi:hypothetical protein
VARAGRDRARRDVTDRRVAGREGHLSGDLEVKVTRNRWFGNRVIDGAALAAVAGDARAGRVSRVRDSDAF